jgi:hypothetical protein
MGNHRRAGIRVLPRAFRPAPPIDPAAFDKHSQGIRISACRSRILMTPREWVMRPAPCTLLATSVTDVRLTPSISARNSWVKFTASLAARSALSL